MTVSTEAVVNGRTIKANQLAALVGIARNSAKARIYRFNKGIMSAEDLLGPPRHVGQRGNREVRHKIDGKMYSTEDLMELTGYGRETVLTRVKRYRDGEIKSDKVFKKANVINHKYYTNGEESYTAQYIAMTAGIAADTARRRLRDWEKGLIPTKQLFSAVDVFADREPTDEWKALGTRERNRHLLAGFRGTKFDRMFEGNYSQDRCLI